MTIFRRVKALVLSVMVYFSGRVWTRLEGLEDSNRYLRYSSTLRRGVSQETLQGLIIRLSHSIEVGLTYKPTKPGFGSAVVLQLMDNLEAYHSRFGADSLVRHATQTLVEYHRRNTELGVDLLYISRRIAAAAEIAGVSFTDPEPLIPDTYNVPDGGDFRQFARTRRSCREYRTDVVPLQDIQDAVQTALHSPSACNRQPCRVYIVSEEAARAKSLQLQGNRSKWRGEAGRTLIVTARLGYYRGIRERNAAYIDGGLFCMTLAYALHDKGLGTCMLNLNLRNSDLEELREAIGAGPDEVFMMMIATGYAKSDFSVCRKYQRQANEIIEFVGDAGSQFSDVKHAA